MLLSRYEWFIKKQIKMFMVMKIIMLASLEVDT